MHAAADVLSGHAVRLCNFQLTDSLMFCRLIFSWKHLLAKCTLQLMHSLYMRGASATFKCRPDLLGESLDFSATATLECKHT